MQQNQEENELVEYWDDTVSFQTAIKDHILPSILSSTKHILQVPN